ncbi:sensor domain-containing diguanylate cyclase [Methylobacterium nodulans]|uniref:Diguanylate cyclase/phosphodiesterase with PAS/PAC and MHYT sensor(S) n=1 Tax=Methylobacterium nodulans (strain LMG 21967 / CNCM I-2342 / ORS 2060) TaxID=460265 RepID=B8INP3_METNO|nr:EAL domain-containing protein [Methylobacterium nodulans]ACL58409.1 diguanylate cyclase/phosphodiesterase with PAS/PAC and MHYT sensor(s) [Methylobacterium nodulans ORS 2060]
MLKVVGCFVGAHDLWLVALAAAICTLAAITTVGLLHHACRTTRWLRFAWVCVAAVAGGSGIWATHFIAMLAFEPGLPSGYDIGLTVRSLAYAVVLTGLGLAVTLLRRIPFTAGLGGLILGSGIAAMHYTGMAAFEIAGRIIWDPTLVAASLVLGALLGGAALPVALGPHGVRSQTAGALLLLGAICSLHFIAMGALTIVPDPSIAISETAVPSRWLAVAVALASGAILLLAGGALALDIRDRRTIVESERLRSLANAAVEGLVVCRDDIIVSANDSFGRLVGIAATAVAESSLSRFLPDPATRLALTRQSEQLIETELRGAEGEMIPVEVIMRPVTYGRRPHFAVAVRDLRARRQAEGRIQFLAHHDALTGLANRTSFTQRLDLELKLAEATGRKLAVLCLDLDRFKEVNDLFGHAAGDAMLVNVARVVTGILGETQMMARLGGDEFAVLAACDHAITAGHLAERILEALRSENADAAGPLVATSIGIALYPDDASERDVLLSHADTALYRAKSEGRGTYRFFEHKMGVQVRDRRILEHELRHAVARGEMHLVYQPQTQVETGEVIGFEVLLRWHHPERGAVSPAVFIPIAEESGAILQIGEWVLRQACRDAASWPNPLAVAVNVSAVQIHAPHFVQLVHEVLLQTGLKPDRLEIEITETALIRDPVRALSTLRQVKALGVHIAMDDFGTGYSSLSNLRSFPFDKIKIDPSFIRAVDTNEQTAAIVRSVLGLGRGLGLPVLAEGVETDAELRFLAAENCDAAQGYLMGRPAPIERFSQFTHGIQDEPGKPGLVA